MPCVSVLVNQRKPQFKEMKLPDISLFVVFCSKDKQLPNYKDFHTGSFLSLLFTNWIE